MAPIWQLLEPMSQLHAGIGFIRHVDPAGVTPSVSCVALISKGLAEPSLYRMVCVPPTKRRGLAWKHSSVSTSTSFLGQRR